MPTHYSTMGSVYLDGQLLSDSCRMSWSEIATTGSRAAAGAKELKINLNLTFGKLCSKHFLKLFGMLPETYAYRVTVALRAEGGRYAEAWLTGGNPYMSRGKAKRIGRLMRIQARARRLQGV